LSEARRWARSLAYDEDFRPGLVKRLREAVGARAYRADPRLVATAVLAEALKDHVSSAL
jgi:hypothetical protein